MLADLAYVTDASATGVLVSQPPGVAQVGSSPPVPTTALFTVPVAAAFTVAV